MHAEKTSDKTLKLNGSGPQARERENHKDNPTLLRASRQFALDRVNSRQVRGRY